MLFRKELDKLASSFISLLLSALGGKKFEPIFLANLSSPCGFTGKRFVLS
jgi:hypothetical protein